MIQQKAKKCKGTGPARGFGCNKMTVDRFYGLCYECKKTWLYSTKEGSEVLKKYTIKASRQLEKEKKQKVRKEKRENNENSAMRLADTYFSRYIRIKHSENGFCTCYTCGDIKPIKQLDNGHYMKRTHKATRYLENNCRPQCKTCNGNTLHNGKQVEFRINLVNEIGLAEVEIIEKLSQESIKADYHFFKEIADEYREKVNELQKELGVKYW